MKPVAMPCCQMGICRRSSGVREAGCSMASVSRTRRVAPSILLRNRKRGSFRSSSSRRMSCSAGILRSSASHTTTAASHSGNAWRMSLRNSTEPGQSMNVMRSPRYSALATFASMLIAWARASTAASPTLVESRTEPCRDSAPVRARRLSRSVVLPLWKGPTIAMSRGPATRVEIRFAASTIAASCALPVQRRCEHRFERRVSSMLSGVMRDCKTNERTPCPRKAAPATRIPRPATLFWPRSIRS